MTRVRRNLAQVHFNLDLDNPAQAKLYAHIRHLAAKGDATDFLVKACVSALPNMSHIKPMAEKIAKADAPRTPDVHELPKTMIPEPPSRTYSPSAWSDNEVTYAPIEGEA